MYGVVPGSISSLEQVTVLAKPELAIKCHGDAAVSCESDTETDDGEPSAPAGFLGRGKIIISWSSVGPELSISGYSHTGDCSAEPSLVKD